MRAQFEKPVIAVDLGASFTKVSYRPAWQEGPSFRTPCKLVMIEGSVLIPSLVVNVTRAAESLWLCGKDASRYKPKSTDKVFRNWKAGFFREDPRDLEESIIAAKQFFIWLHRQLTTVGLQVQSTRVKLCLPAFPEVDRQASRIISSMLSAGWCEEISTVEEPRANTIGIFSEGRNVLTEVERPGMNRAVNPNFFAMYGHDSAILSHLRGTFRDTSELIINIVDIGSYTTDVSVVTVDAAGDGDYISRVSQISYDIGITKDYEEELLRLLAEKHHFRSEELTFTEVEEIKRAICLHQQFTWTDSLQRLISVGKDSADITIAKQIADSFSWKVKEAFLRTESAKEGRLILFTGGGCEATLIREALDTVFKDKGGMKVYEGTETESREKEKGNLSLWADSGQPLSRLATAIGGGSVLIDLPKSVPVEAYPHPAQHDSEWVVCSCGGRNKGCVWCEGKGYHSKVQGKVRVRSDIVKPYTNLIRVFPENPPVEALALKRYSGNEKATRPESKTRRSRDSSLQRKSGTRSSCFVKPEIQREQTLTACSQYVFEQQRQETRTAWSQAEILLERAMRSFHLSILARRPEGFPDIFRSGVEYLQGGELWYDPRELRPDDGHILQEGFSWTEERDPCFGIRRPGGQAFVLVPHSSYSGRVSRTSLPLRSACSVICHESIVSAVSEYLAEICTSPEQIIAPQTIPRDWRLFCQVIASRRPTNVPDALRNLDVSSEVEIVPQGGLRILGKQMVWLQGASPKLIVEGLDGEPISIDGTKVEVTSEGLIESSNLLNECGTHVVRVGSTQQKITIVQPVLGYKGQPLSDKAIPLYPAVIGPGDWILVGRRTSQTFTVRNNQYRNSVVTCGFDPVWALNLRKGKGTMAVLIKRIAPDTGSNLGEADNSLWISALYQVNRRRPKIESAMPEVTEGEARELWSEYYALARSLKRARKRGQ